MASKNFSDGSHAMAQNRNTKRRHKLAILDGLADAKSPGCLMMNSPSVNISVLRMDRVGGAMLITRDFGVTLTAIAGYQRLVTAARSALE